MATENVKLKVDVETGQAAKSLSDLKKEFRDLQTQLSNTEVGTKEYVDTLKKLGETKDDIGDLRDQITALGSNAEKFQAVGKVVQGVAGGFAAASSAAALFGGEAEEVQKAMLKVQAALAVQQGISAILELGDAFKALKLVLLSNPIFLIAAAIAAIIGYFVGLENIMKGVSVAFKALGQAAEATFNFIIDSVEYAIELNLKLFDLMTLGLFNASGAYEDYKKGVEEANEAERKRVEALTEQIKKSEELIATLEDQVDANNKLIDANKEREKAVTKLYDNEIELANAAGENTQKLEQDKLEFVRKSLDERFQLQLDNLEKEKLIAAEQLRRAEALSQRKQAGDNLTSQLAKIGAKERVKIANDEIKETQTLIDANAQQIKVKEAESLKERREAGKAAYEQRLKDEEDFLKRKKALEEIYAEQDRKFREDAAKEYLALRKGVVEEEIQINFDALETNVKINEQKSIDDTTQLVDDLKLFKATQDAKVAMLSQTLTTLGSLTELFGKKNEANAKKAFEINKALSIADAVIKTYQSANSIFASAAANPATVLFPAQPFIAAGLAIASGLANVAKISQTQFGGGASQGGGGSTPSAPSVNSPSSTGSNSIGTTLLNRQAIEQGQQPSENRVYVVESDVTNTQGRVRGIRNRATVVE